MGSFRQPAIVINRRTRVDYCKVTYPSLRINNNARHNSNAATDRSTARNHCRGTHRVDDVIPDVPKMTTNPHASGVVSDSNKCLIDSFFSKTQEIVIRSNDWHTQHRSALRILIDKARDFEIPCSLENLYYDLCMAASADNHYWG